jgi:hypothetical protein
MKQSRTMSMVEAATNVAVGFIVAVAAQVLLFPMFGVVIPLADNVRIGVVFTAVSIVRSFVLRRAFEAVRARAERKPPPEGGGAFRSSSANQAMR